MNNTYNIDMTKYNTDLAMTCRSGISFSPEKRGAYQIKTETKYLIDCKDELFKLVKEDTEIKLYNEVMDYFINRYIEKLNECNQAMSGCVSSMIAGPANFKPNRRANDSYDKRINELTEIFETSKTYFTRRLKKLRTQEAGGELAQKIAELEKLQTKQDNMKAINKIFSSKKISNEDKISQCRELKDLPINLIEELKIVLSNKEEMTSLRVFGGCTLTNNNAKIKARQSYINRQEKIAQRIEDKGAITKFEYRGGEIVQDLESQRINILFDGKPSQEIINEVKSHGFKWSPRFSQWTRKLTPNAVYSVRRMLQAV